MMRGLADSPHDAGSQLLQRRSRSADAGLPGPAGACEPLLWLLASPAAAGAAWANAARSALPAQQMAAAESCGHAEPAGLQSAPATAAATAASLAAAYFQRVQTQGLAESRDC